MKVIKIIINGSSDKIISLSRSLCPLPSFPSSLLYKSLKLSKKRSDVAFQSTEFHIIIEKNPASFDRKIEEFSIRPRPVVISSVSQGACFRTVKSEKSHFLRKEIMASFVVVDKAKNKFS